MSNLVHVISYEDSEAEMALPKYHLESCELRRLAAEDACGWGWTNHALSQMRDRGITAPDVKQALIQCHVDLIERKQDDVWRVVGSDIDGNRVTVACVPFFDEKFIRVVTAF